MYIHLDTQCVFIRVLQEEDRRNEGIAQKKLIKLTWVAQWLYTGESESLDAALFTKGEAPVVLVW